MPDSVKPDYYAILGVSRSARPEELRLSYRSLAKRYHPDMNPGDKAAEAKFKELNEAYDVLKDEKKRAAYDTPVEVPESEPEEPPQPPFTVPADERQVLWSLEPAEYQTHVRSYIRIDPRAEEWFRKHPPPPKTRAAGYTGPQATASPPYQPVPPRPNTSSTPNGPAPSILVVAGVVAVLFGAYQAAHWFTPVPQPAVYARSSPASPQAQGLPLTVQPLAPHCTLGTTPGIYDVDKDTCRPTSQPAPAFAGLSKIPMNTLEPCPHEDFDSSKSYMDQTTCTVRERPLLTVPPDPPTRPNTHQRRLVRSAPVRPAPSPRPSTDDLNRRSVAESKMFRGHLSAPAPIQLYSEAVPLH